MITKLEDDLIRQAIDLALISIRRRTNEGSKERDLAIEALINLISIVGDDLEAELCLGG